MCKVGRAVQRVDVPAVFVLEAGSGTFFAEDAVIGERGAEAIDDQGLAGAVGFGNEIDVALVLGCHALTIKLAEQGPGFTRDVFCYFEECLHATILPKAMRTQRISGRGVLHDFRSDAFQLRRIQ